MEMAWRRLSSASVSTAAPGRAAAGLPTDCQPRAGVRILTMSPAAARMSSGGVSPNRAVVVLDSASWAASTAPFWVLALPLASSVLRWAAS